MHRTVIALAIAGLAVSGAGVASAGPGNGAQKSGITATDGLSPIACGTADGAGAGRQAANGFVVLNAPGKPAKDGKNARVDGTRKLVGEVALRGAAPSTEYDVRVANSEVPGDCGDSVGSFVTDPSGNGRLAFQERGLGAGRYHVVLLERPFDGVPRVEDLVERQRFASAPVTVR